MPNPFSGSSKDTKCPKSLDGLLLHNTLGLRQTSRPGTSSGQDCKNSSQPESTFDSAGQEALLQSPFETCARVDERTTDTWLRNTDGPLQHVTALCNQANSLGSLLLEVTALQKTVKAVVNQGSPSATAQSNLSIYKDQVDNIAQRLESFKDASSSNLCANASIPSDTADSLNQDQEVSSQAEQTADDQSQPSVAETQLLIDLTSIGFSRKKAEELVKGITGPE